MKNAFHELTQDAHLHIDPHELLKNLPNEETQDVYLHVCTLASLNRFPSQSNDQSAEPTDSPMSDNIHSESSPKPAHAIPKTTPQKSRTSRWKRDKSGKDVRGKDKRNEKEK